MYRVRIPFCFPISHSLARRDCTDALLVRAEAEGGVVGLGEGTPRRYVTGEDMEGCIEAAVSFVSGLVSRRWDPEGLFSWLSTRASMPLARRYPSAWCAVELSMLDLLARWLGRPLWRVFATRLRSSRCTYSAVIPMVDGAVLDGLLQRVRGYGMKQVKVKVGDPGGTDERLAKAREVLGPEVEIRVDANGAFSSSGALDFLARSRRHRIAAIEQPVPKDDLEGLKEVSSRQDVPVIVDESLCSLEDAGRLIDNHACHGFNIRISKCGGFLNALRMWETAREHGIFCQIGCHVGETAVLSAAGRHLALLGGDQAYLEGSFSHMLLKEDVSVEPVCFGPGGEAESLPGPGLGIEPDEDVIGRWGELVCSEPV